MKRKRRPGEVVCNCGAYKFPHRMMGGECDGAAFVEEVFEGKKWASCRDCMLRETTEEEGHRCQVVDGREPPRECPDLQEFVLFERIRLYGVNKPPEKKRGWRP